MSYCQSAKAKPNERHEKREAKRRAQAKRFMPKMFDRWHQKWHKYWSLLSPNSTDNNAVTRYGQRPINAPLHAIDYTRLSSQMLLLPGELRNQIYDYLIPLPSVGSEGVLAVPHPWIHNKSYFPYARISPPLPEFPKNANVPCFEGRGQLWEEYTDRYSTAASFTIEGRFDIDLASKLYPVEIPDEDGVVQKYSIREANLVRRCVDEKILPTLVQGDLFGPCVEVVGKEVNSRSTTLSDLEYWLPKIRKCTLLLHLYGKSLGLLPAQIRPTISLHDMNTFLNVPKLADKADKAADGIVELMKAIASIFRFSKELDTLEVVLKFDDSVLVPSHTGSIAKIRSEVLNKWIGPLREVKTVNGVTIKCLGKTGWEGSFTEIHM
jgi:hypothetical protein